MTQIFGQSMGVTIYPAIHIVPKHLSHIVFSIHEMLKTGIFGHMCLQLGRGGLVTGPTAVTIQNVIKMDFPNAAILSQCYISEKPSPITAAEARMYRLKVWMP
jgi:hypothetical protein